MSRRKQAKPRALKDADAAAEIECKHEDEICVKSHICAEEEEEEEEEQLFEPVTAHKSHLTGERDTKSEAVTESHVCPRSMAAGVWACFNTSLCT